MDNYLLVYIQKYLSLFDLFYIIHLNPFMKWDLSLIHPYFQQIDLHNTNKNLRLVPIVKKPCVFVFILNIIILCILFVCFS